MNNAKQTYDATMSREFGHNYMKYMAICEFHGFDHYPERLSEEDQLSVKAGQLICDSPTSDGNAESEE